MIVAGVAISCIGVVVTIGLAIYVQRKSQEIITRVSDAVLYTFPGAKDRKRLLEDIQRTGVVRGYISERKLGEYSIDWFIPGHDKW